MKKNLHFTFSFVSNSGTTTVILGVVIPIAICLIIIVVVVIILLFRRKKSKPKHNNVELHVNKDNSKNGVNKSGDGNSLGFIFSILFFFSKEHCN